MRGQKWLYRTGGCDRLSLATQGTLVSRLCDMCVCVRAPSRAIQTNPRPPKSEAMDPRASRDCQRGLKSPSRTIQERPKAAQETPRVPQERPKTTRRTSRRHPREGQEAPKGHQEAPTNPIAARQPHDDRSAPRGMLLQPCQHGFAGNDLMLGRGRPVQLNWGGGPWAPPL